MPKNPDEVGALWKKTSSKGTVFLSGKIDGIGSVVVFAIKDKRSEKSPDYRVLRSKPMSDQPERREIDESEIPF